MVQKIDFLEDQVSIPRDVHRSSVALVDLPVDEGAFPHSHVQVLMAHADDLSPVDGCAAVEVHSDVRVLTRFLKVVAAAVAGSDRLDEGPARSAEIRGGVELQRSQLLHTQSGQDGIHKFPRPGFHLRLVERLLEVGVENEDFVLETEV